MTLTLQHWPVIELNNDTIVFCNGGLMLTFIITLSPVYCAEHALKRCCIKCWRNNLTIREAETVIDLIRSMP